MHDFKYWFLSLVFLFCTEASLSQTPADTRPTLSRVTESSERDDPKTLQERKLEGVVRLKVQVLADGSVGEVKDVTKKNRKKLAEAGLTQQAIDAVRKAKFDPAMKNGAPVSKTRIVEYTFTLL